VICWRSRCAAPCRDRYRRYHAARRATLAHAANEPYPRLDRRVLPVLPTRGGRAKAHAPLEGLAIATPRRPRARAIAIFKEATQPLEADFWEMGWLLNSGRWVDPANPSLP